MIDLERMSTRSSLVLAHVLVCLVLQKDLHSEVPANVLDAWSKGIESLPDEYSETTVLRQKRYSYRDKIYRDFEDISEGQYSHNRKVFFHKEKSSAKWNGTLVRPEGVYRFSKINEDGRWQLTVVPDRDPQKAREELARHQVFMKSGFLRLGANGPRIDQLAESGLHTFIGWESLQSDLNKELKIEIGWKADRQIDPKDQSFSSITAYLDPRVSFRVTRSKIKWTNGPEDLTEDYVPSYFDGELPLHLSGYRDEVVSDSKKSIVSMNLKVTEFSKAPVDEAVFDLATYGIQYDIATSWFSYRSAFVLSIVIVIAGLISYRLLRR